LSFFFYENSYRRLLTILSDKIQQATTQRDKHAKHKEAEDDSEQRYIESLLKSAKAVNEECKKLGFWSDVRNLASDGKVMGGMDSDVGWRHEWQALDADDLSKDQMPILPTEKAASEDHKEAEKGGPEEAIESGNVGEEVNDPKDKQDKDVEIE
jgi:hypothetical protein